MPSYRDVANGIGAVAEDVQQLIEAWSGRRNIPQSLIINDSINSALLIKNSDAGGKAVSVLAPDGTTVLFSVDATGAKVSRTGGAAEAPVTQLGPGSSQAAGGDHVHGAGGYSTTGTTTLEALFAATWVTTAVNYGSGGTFGAGILFVFCTSGVTVTLPAAATTNRPITVIAITGTTTVAAAGGSVIGGSVNTTTGAVMNGTVSPGDSITYKSDGTNWRAV